MRAIVLAGLLSISIPSLWGAEHRPLLPQPGSIHYGESHLQSKGLSIECKSTPSSEDRFAAQKLEEGIAEQTGVKLPIATASKGGTAIVFSRIDTVDALPEPGEIPGPDSREAYKLSVREHGIQITGRSSAAIFYGVQTRLQMIEGHGSHYTKDQIRDIVAYGKARHIDVIPAVELYGHLHDLFRIEKYSSQADFPHGGEFDPTDPKVKVLLDDWISQLAELFPSPFIFAGFDETWSIQEAANTSGVDATPVKLFVDQLSYVTKSPRARNKAVLAFADTMVKFPGIVHNLPKGLIAVPWYYDAAPDPEYKHWLNPLVEQHVPTLVASGVNSWVEITPNYDVSFDNIDTFLAAGRKAKTLGLINTLWTDDNQVLLKMSWPGIAYGAIAPWQSEPINRSKFFPEYAEIMYPATAAEDMAQALIALNAAEVAFYEGCRKSYEYCCVERSFCVRDAGPYGWPARESSTDTPACGGRARASAPCSVSRCCPNSALRLVGWSPSAGLAGMKVTYALEITDIWSTLPPHPSAQQVRDALDRGVYSWTHSRILDLMDGVTQLRLGYREAWLSQYSDYRLGTALGRWDAEYEYWRRAQNGFEEFVANFHEGDPLPSLIFVARNSSER
jgi:hexosaminidase